MQAARSSSGPEASAVVCTSSTPVVSRSVSANPNSTSTFLSSESTSLLDLKDTNDKYKKFERRMIWERTARTSKSLAQIWERAYDCFGSLIGWRVWLKRFKELPNENQEQVLFFVSTLFGTITFLVLFECLYRINLYNLEQTDLVFSVSYTEAYFISILWQHILNRWLVASLAISPFWSSLLQTYFVYSLSLAMMACSGAVMIRLFGVSPRIVTMFTLPTSGVLNFYFLRFVTSKESRDVPDDTLV